VGGMWEMLLLSHSGERGDSRGFTPSDWGKIRERQEVDWYEDDAGSVPSSGSAPDNMGERHCADKMGERHEDEDDAACVTS
jgi:hypothetical protein